MTGYEYEHVDEKGGTLMIVDDDTIGRYVETGGTVTYLPTDPAELAKLTAALWGESFTVIRESELPSARISGDGRGAYFRVEMPALTIEASSGDSPEWFRQRAFACLAIVRAIEQFRDAEKAVRDAERAEQERAREAKVEAWRRFHLDHLGEDAIHILVDHDIAPPVLDDSIEPDLPNGVPENPPPFLAKRIRTGGESS